MDNFLSPFAQRVKYYLTDTTHFLTTLEDFHDLPTDTWLVMADVVSLYTTIPNASGIHAPNETLQDLKPKPKVKPSNDSIIQLLEFVLTKNNFKFNGQHYLKVGGTSMGTNAAPSYANTYMSKFE